ncbi:MAG TPA: aldo/keto reductase [Desulfobulbaceae bacterium]|nr:MAG: aldo/keto reductase [Deltaproteobacteria bacterium RIFOXYD12_FULL_53_23]HCC54605.1 aldo/keto reductase [Desulfobulbaceae bacterium]
MKLALGTVQFGLPYGIANQSGQVSLAEAREILKVAGASGMTMLDTAVVYGESEQRLGEIGVQGWQIVSKLPSIPEGCIDYSRWIAEAVDGSLQRLKVKSLYGLLLHRPQQLLERCGDQLYRVLQQLKQDGLVQKVGISIYDPSELDTLCGRFQFDLVQAPFNVLDRRLIETGWLTRLAEHGTELHVRSIFLQGLLLMHPTGRDKRFACWGDLWSDWDNWLSNNRLTPLQACLRYVLSFPQISKVVVGVDSMSQLQEILAAAAGVMPKIPEELSSGDINLVNPANWSALI